ncbi:MAG: hypothetical protein ABJB86_15695 [Bacteroidota bacterium]
MGLLSFLKNRNKPIGQGALMAPEKMGADGKKTQLVCGLLQIPAAQRNENWQREFYEHVQTAGFECGDPQTMIGPDGYTFFVLKTPETNEPAEPVCIQNIKDDILEKGYGIVINPTDTTADWVFSYGDIVNLHLTKSFISDMDNIVVRNIEMTKRVEVIKKGEDITLAQPSEKYLPQRARDALKKFLQGKGITRPMVMLMCRKSRGAMIQELAFNIFPEDFSSAEERDHRIRQIAWFLPRHYLIASFNKNTNMAKYFADL